MRFTLVLAALAGLAAAAPAPETACKAVEKSPYPKGAICGEEGDLKNAKFEGTPKVGMSFEDCATECKNDSKCKSFLFHPIDGVKSGVCAPYTENIADQGLILTKVKDMNFFWDKSCFSCK